MKKVVFRIYILFSVIYIIWFLCDFLYYNLDFYPPINSMFYLTAEDPENNQYCKNAPAMYNIKNVESNSKYIFISSNDSIFMFDFDGNYIGYFETIYDNFYFKADENNLTIISDKSLDYNIKSKSGKCYEIVYDLNDIYETIHLSPYASDKSDFIKQYERDISQKEYAAKNNYKNKKSCFIKGKEFNYSFYGKLKSNDKIIDLKPNILPLPHRYMRIGIIIILIINIILYIKRKCIKKRSD